MFFIGDAAGLPLPFLDSTVRGTMRGEDVDIFDEPGEGHVMEVTLAHELAESSRRLGYSLGGRALKLDPGCMPLSEWNGELFAE